MELASLEVKWRLRPQSPVRGEQIKFAETFIPRTFSDLDFRLFRPISERREYVGILRDPHDKDPNFRLWVGSDVTGIAFATLRMRHHLANLGLAV
jgi:hypothetical protein